MRTQPVPAGHDVGVETSTRYHEPAAPAVEARRTLAVWSWYLLRAGVTVQALLTFLQPVYAGRFLSGDFGMLQLHRFNGTLVGIATMVQLPTTLLVWLVGRGPWQLFAIAVAFGVAVALQLYAGFNHVLGLHIPLGVTIVGCAGWLLVWVWRHGPGVAGGRG
jgi:hypothetical protein